VNQDGLVRICKREQLPDMEFRWQLDTRLQLFRRRLGNIVEAVSATGWMTGKKVKRKIEDGAKTDHLIEGMGDFQGPEVTRNCDVPAGKGEFDWLRGGRNGFPVLPFQFAPMVDGRSLSQGLFIHWDGRPALGIRAIRMGQGRLRA
jgi:hypothetical protein